MTAEGQALSKIESLLRQHPKGLTTSAIARSLSGNRNSTAKYLEILVSSGVAERKQVGASRVYTLSKKISLTSLMNYTSEFILVLDSDARIITVNESFLRFFNVARESLEGKSADQVPLEFLRLFHGSNSVCNPACEVVTEHTSVIGGETCYFRVRCLPTRIDDRETGYTVLIDNISDQKKYEQMLVQSEAKYRAIIETQTDLICRRKTDGTITFVNNEFLRFFNRKPAEIVGSSFFPHDLHFQEGQDSPGIPVQILPFYKDICEQCVLLDQGEMRWIQWKNTSLSDPTGTIAEIQSIGRDITVQRQRDLEILLKRCSIESSDHAIVLFDIIGRIVYANKSFLTLFRYPDDFAIIGTPFEQFIPQSGPGMNINQLASVLIQRGEVDCCIKGRRADNTEIDLELHCTQIRNDLNFPLNTIALVLKGNSNTGSTVTSLPSATLRPAVPLSGFVILDPYGRVLSANRQFLIIGGYSDETQILGKCFADLVDSALPFPVVQGIRSGDSRSLKDGVTGGQLLHRNGSMVPFRFTVRHICDTRGRELCLEVETEPADSQSLLNADSLTDLLQIPLFMTDLHKRVIIWNRAMEAFTGIMRKDVLGTNAYRQAFYPFIGIEPLLIDLVEQPLEKIRQIYPGVKRFGDTIILERYIPDTKKAEGTYLYDKAGMLFDAGGNVIGYMGGIQDITEWKRSRNSMTRLKDEIEASLHPRMVHLEERIGTINFPVCEGQVT